MTEVGALLKPSTSAADGFGTLVAVMVMVMLMQPYSFSLVGAVQFSLRTPLSP
jgi:hypothetical protein